MEPEGHLLREDRDKVNALLQAFFPPTPTIEREEALQTSTALYMAPILDEEIEAVAIRMNPWKAPGEDQIPAEVWQRLWPTVSRSVCSIFRSSITLGYVPSQWRITKIILLQKPGRDSSQPNSYHLISHLSTLGKILEAVITQ